MPPHSAPEPATLNLAARILAAGKARLSAADEASYTNPDSLATAVIEAGCKGVEAEDVAQHGRLARGSPGSQAQSVMERAADPGQPEPRAAQIVRQRIHSEWLFGDVRLQRLADTVIELGLPGGAAAPASAQGPEAAARQALGEARRQLAAAEGNHISAGGDAAEVDSAFDTFDPPIRRHALADIVVQKLQQAAAQHALGAAEAPGTAVGLGAAET